MRKPRVAVLTGAGRTFSAGADFNHFVRTLDDSNRGVPGDELLAEARALASKLEAQPRGALRATKKVLNMNLASSAPQILETTLHAQLTATLSDEHHEPAQAFLDRQRRNREGSS
jgi:enoyl-CoA hydratase/carnithine racemase